MKSVVSVRFCKTIWGFVFYINLTSWRWSRIWGRDRRWRGWRNDRVRRAGHRAPQVQVVQRLEVAGSQDLFAQHSVLQVARHGNAFIPREKGCILGNGLCSTVQVNLCLKYLFVMSDQSNLSVKGLSSFLVSILQYLPFQVPWCQKTY